MLRETPLPKHHLWKAGRFCGVREDCSQWCSEMSFSLTIWLHRFLTPWKKKKQHKKIPNKKPWPWKPPQTRKQAQTPKTSSQFQETPEPTEWGYNGPCWSLCACTAREGCWRTEHIPLQLPWEHKEDSSATSLVFSPRPRDQLLQKKRQWKLEWSTVKSWHSPSLQQSPCTKHFLPKMDVISLAWNKAESNRLNSSQNNRSQETQACLIFSHCLIFSQKKKSQKSAVCQPFPPLFSPLKDSVSLKKQRKRLKGFHIEPLQKLPRFLPYQLKSEWHESKCGQGEGGDIHFSSLCL